ncbi:flagellar transcriptional regulator FlhD [Cupriavidus yeoncheonensis]|uniref:flagellar transcriptional regulator FlhD n=1 Tax=Cupriavidus yeoncheonensis TaxID=1462994 RepID=UPI001BAB001E|nr:flagellar transcriptional regulator FlhD [Cupriavidus yeoncheonensis]
MATRASRASLVSWATSIADLNFAYLQLARRLAQGDSDMAMHSLGCGAEMVAAIARLTTEQLLRVSKTNLFLCRIDLRLLSRFLESAELPGADVESKQITGKYHS